MRPQHRSGAAWRPWVLLAVFSLAGFLINASTFYALGVVLPDMVRDQGWSWVEAGFGFTVLGAAVGSSSYFPALLIRRFGVRATLLLGAAVMMGGFACWSMVHGLALYFLGSALCGVGYQMVALIPGTHVIAAVFPRRGMPFSVYFACSALGGVAGPWMVLGVMHGFHDDWRLLWRIQMAGALLIGAACAAIAGGPAWLARAADRTDKETLAEVAGPARGNVWRTAAAWSLRDAVRTPQYYILLMAYFGHLLMGVTVSSLSVAHLTERGITTTVAGAMLSLEALVQTGGRAVGGLLGDRFDPRYILVFALAALSAGALALSIADGYPMMLLYAVGSGLGFGLTALAVTMLLLNYYGRKHNLEIFSLTCLVGTVSALGPTLGGFLRDRTGGFGTTFQLYAGVIAVVFVAAGLMRPPRKGGDAPDKRGGSAALTPPG
ncbi:MAG: MFS transporter [Caulobacteraceae bacterium]|nr:MFS transporter [Caulobacteraceae bacterium]